MSEYPNYLIHYGTQGQKWGVRRYQNEDGTYTSEGLERRRTKEGYKELKRDYKKSVKEADKEYRNFVKRTGKNSIQTSKQKDYEASDKVDEFAYKKANELFKKYKDLKMYKAELKGKDFDTSKLGMQTYFEHFGIEDSIFNISAPAVISYSAREVNGKTKIRKNVYINY